MSNFYNHQIIIQKLDEIESLAKELREAILQIQTNNLQPSSKINSTGLQYTLEDMYDAFGKKKHYPVRLKKALERKGITTLEDFLKMSIGELLELDYVGYETLLNTKKALSRLGISW